MTGSSKRLQFYITLTCYIFLSFGIFCPVFTAKNFTASLIVCFATAVIYALIISKAFSIQPFFKKDNCIIHKLLSVAAAFFSISAVLLLMTEVVKDTCFIAGRGVSREYYLMLSAMLLASSLYLCFNSEKGIYRFTFIGIASVLIFTVASVFPIFTVKQAVFDFYKATDSSVKSTVLDGIKAGLFLSCDISVFLYCFKDCFCFDKGYSRLTGYSVITAFILWCIPIFSTLIIFGRNLTAALHDPLYALTKAFGGFDITELLSALRIFSFIIKSSVYVYSASICIKRAYFASKKHALKVIIPIIFATVPAVFLPFIIIGASDSYGKFQSLIYPCVIILSLIFVIFILLRKKED